MKKQFSLILFYGALWGILEASIGHILHFVPTTIAGSVMFPIASVILINAYSRLDSKRALFYVAIVASMVKSIDLFLPAISVYKTINPMMAFIFEALLVVAVISLVTKDNVKSNALGMQVASISWRAMFIGYMAVQYVISGNLAPYISDLNFALSFLLIEGVISALLATGLFYMVKFIKSKERLSFRVSPAFSASLFVLALILTYYL